MGEFSVKFDGFDAFMNHSNNAVYSEPKDHSFFEKIKSSYHSIAKNILQDSSDIWPYHPHLTLVNRLDGESAIKLIAELKMHNFSQNYSFDRVVLYKKEADDKNWIELSSNKLEK